MNLLGIDFEDWYHPELIQKYVKNLEHNPTMFKGLDKIIDMLRKLNEKSSWIIDSLVESNYVYDSSIVPAKTELYGLPNAEIRPYHITKNSLEKNDPTGKLIEFPLLVTKFLGKKLPAAGGFYLRTLPEKIIKNAIKNYEKQNIPATFYIHSWELTPEFMPKVKLPVKENFVTFHNIEKAFKKMNKLINEFEFTSFSNFLSKTPIFD